MKSICAAIVISFGLASGANPIITQSPIDNSNQMSSTDDISPEDTPLGQLNSLQKQDAPKANSPANDEIEKLKQQLQTLQSENEQLQKTNDRVVKRLMRAVHRGPHSPLVKFEQTIEQKDNQLDWKELDAKAKLVAIMADALANRGNEEGYTKTAKAILKSTEEKDFKNFKTSVSALKASCGACHGWAPPR